MTENTMDSAVLEVEGLLILCDKAVNSNKKRVTDTYDKISELRRETKKVRKFKTDLKTLKSSIRENVTLSDEEKQKLDDVKTYLCHKI